MKNTAFLIGVSDYNREQQLPACKHDVQRVRQLLEATAKYGEISTITDNVTASRLKDGLRSFFAKYKEDQIDEAFVYFSGHGSFNPSLDEVFLCCKDYDPSKPGTTSVITEAPQYRYETRTLSRPASLTATHNLPFEKCQVVFQPNSRPSLKPFCLFIDLVFSRTEVLLLSALARYVEAGWDKYAVDTSTVEWQQQLLLWRDVVQTPAILFERSFQRAVESIHYSTVGMTFGSFPKECR
jgi:hypothetical protein